jgi:aldehyde:ferredoxin oxidoreductase|tara:strand:+ start:728 stop:2662 length:1935 start_codon:yes stop_codon:yes gene_type:complete
MAIAGGFCPHILRVDLNQETIIKEALPPEEDLRKYLGGIGLGLLYLLREAPPKGQATDPDVPLIFMNGPLTGTPAVNSSDVTIVSFHNCTPYSAAVGHTHGFWGAYLKHAGHQGIIFTGRASKPVYLWIDDDQVEFRDASHLWGEDTRETERRIKVELGDDTEISVACIGPAGEVGIAGAMIKNDRNHGAGKGGLGTAMGAKHLKAIAVRGTGTVPLFDAPGLVETATEWESKLFPGDPGKRTVAEAMKDGGNSRNYYDTFGSHRRVIGKNMTDPEWGAEFARKYVEACSRWTITPQPSYNCKISCAYDVKITDGPFAGFTGSKCGGAEPLEGSSSIIGVDDPAAIVVLNDFYDGLGIEMGQFSPMMGAIYEAYNEGLFHQQDIGGLDLTWGNWESAMELMNQVVRNEGFGAKLAQGPKEMVKTVGAGMGIEEELRNMIIDMKGGGAVMHDHRASWSAFFCEMTAGYGASTQGRGTDTFARPDLGYNEVTPGIANNLEEALGKVEGVYRTQIIKLFWDTLGICSFGAVGIPGSVCLTSTSVAQATGWEDFDEEEAFIVGERISNLLRLVYVRRGFKKSDEFDVSPRFLEITRTGGAEDKGIAPYLPPMVDEYYRLQGWGVDTGAPTPETLMRLGMEEFLEDVMV